MPDKNYKEPSPELARYIEENTTIRHAWYCATAMVAVIMCGLSMSCAVVEHNKASIAIETINNGVPIAQKENSIPNKNEK